ncbi:MAG: zinc ribbon domain-containing protein [Chloroflexota bacterium]|nr:zinc ribbon domain-containing protein [Chloroflexota bacterium]
MPIYDFRCNACQKRASFFVRTVSSPLDASCPSCGSRDLLRLVAPVAYHRSAQDIHEDAGDPDRPGADYYQDPRNIGRWTEKRFQEMGMEIPPEVRQKIDAARDGDMTILDKKGLD